MSRERNNFHEDPLRHYLLKAQNAREDGYAVGGINNHPASKETMREMLLKPGLSEAQKKNLRRLAGDPDPLEEMLAKLSPEKAAQFLAMLRN